MRLSDAQIRGAKAAAKPFKLSDGGGLYLLVKPNGARLWQQAYSFARKQKTLSFGPYPDVGLRDARDRRDAAKKLLRAGVDPGEQKKLDRIAAVTNAANTFDLVAKELIAKKEAEGAAEATISKTRWLLDFASPMIGARPVADISAAEVLAVLKKVEKRGLLESARRLRSVIGEVFRYAIATTERRMIRLLRCAAR